MSNLQNNLMKENQSPDIAFAKEVLLLESEAIRNQIDRLNASFQNAVDLIFNCKGRVVVTGIGKAGIIGQKFQQPWQAREPLVLDSFI